MQSLIISYLLLNKECALPGLGVLKIIHTPASTDLANNKILPPFEQVVFKNGAGSGSTGLVNYIADKKRIEQRAAYDMLKDLCNEWKEKIEAGEKITFDTIGTLQKDRDGSITLNREKNINFLPPVAIHTAYRKDDGQPEIRQENKTNEDPVTVEEGSYTEEVIVERSYWGLWALILLAVGMLILFYHFKDKPLKGSSIGNQQHVTADTATATYRK